MRITTSLLGNKEMNDPFYLFCDGKLRATWNRKLTNVRYKYTFSIPVKYLKCKVSAINLTIANLVDQLLPMYNYSAFHFFLITH